MKYATNSCLAPQGYSGEEIFPFGWIIGAEFRGRHVPKNHMFHPPNEKPKNEQYNNDSNKARTPSCHSLLNFFEVFLELIVLHNRLSRLEQPAFYPVELQTQIDYNQIYEIALVTAYLFNTSVLANTSRLSFFSSEIECLQAAQTHVMGPREP